MRIVIRLFHALESETSLYTIDMTSLFLCLHFPFSFPLLLDEHIFLCIWSSFLVRYKIPAVRVYR